MSPSPRSSAEVPHSPTSPFLHNLHQRLRKGSGASRASSQSSEPIHSPGDAVTQVHDIKATKRYLLSLVRDDWEYSPTLQLTNDSIVPREASAYGLRDESVSEYESGGGRPARIKSEDPYRFDNPDDVGFAIQRRKARTRRLLEQEISWNEGLRIWSLRRDAWTGALPHKPQRTSPDDGSNRQVVGRQRKSLDTTPNWPLPDPVNVMEDHHSLQNDMLDGPYLPIYPPLLPASHSLRSRIKPTAYPTLYSKVVIQALAPNVPIPLNHMINALVEGWKSEGNWPPTPLDPQGVLARKKVIKGESAFQRWKREQDEKKKAARQRAQEVHAEQGGVDHKGMRKSISGVVKKAFGVKPQEQGEDDIDLDLQKIGLTFETEEEITGPTLVNAYV